MDTFIKLTDNNGDIYYANPRNIAFLKVNCAGNTRNIYKVVLSSPERQVILDEKQFKKIKKIFYKNLEE